MKRYVLSGVVFLVCACPGFECRDVLVSDEDQVVTGYRIEGTVLDGLGKPFGNVSIRLFYSFDYLESNAVPDRTYTPSPGETVSVEVFDPKNTLFRSLYSGMPAPNTPLYVPWDKKDDQGSPAPSGLYSVRYTVASQVKSSYLVLVNGSTSAVTDSLGTYVLLDDRLPLGAFPVPLFSNSDAFVGNYRIGEQVVLEFITVGASRSVAVTVGRDRVTRVFVTLG